MISPHYADCSSDDAHNQYDAHNHSFLLQENVRFIIVFDFGGGTLDVSLLSVEGGGLQCSMDGVELG